MKNEVRFNKLLESHIKLIYYVEQLTEEVERLRKETSNSFNETATKLDNLNQYLYPSVSDCNIIDITDLYNIKIDMEDILNNKISNCQNCNSDNIKVMFKLENESIGFICDDCGTTMFEGL